MALRVHPSDRLLELEGTGDSSIPYLGYVEVNLQIPSIGGYNKDVLLLVILTMTYAKKVPVIVGSNIIDSAMGMITKREIAKAAVTWKQVHFGEVMLGSLQLCNMCKRVGFYGGNPSAAPDPTVPNGFHLDDVQGHICTTWRVTIPPF